MRKLVIAAAAVVFVTGGAHAAPSPGGEPPAAKDGSPALKAYVALKAEFDKAAAESRLATQQATTDAERNAARAKAPKPDEYAARFKAIAEKSPKDPAAANAWAWIAQNSRTAALQAEALDGLLAHHVASPVLAGVSQSLQYSQAVNLEMFLLTVLEKSPDHEAKGRACYTLGRVVAARADLASRAAADPAMKGNLEKWYGKDYAEKVLGSDPAELTKGADKLFDRVAKEFADLKYGMSTLGEKAKGDLFELRNLSVGQTAPEIVGEDENGKAIKLSDFKGKVVLLDFWGFW